jgi:hypothetical protein
MNKNINNNKNNNKNTNNADNYFSVFPFGKLI